MDSLQKSGKMKLKKEILTDGKTETRELVRWDLHRVKKSYRHKIMDKDLRQMSLLGVEEFVREE